MRLYRTVEVCRLTGATYRQVDYWVRCGILPAAVPARGSGSVRLFAEEELDWIRVLVALSALRAGATGPVQFTASNVLHRLRDSGIVEIVSGPVMVTITVGEAP